MSKPNGLSTIAKKAARRLMRENKKGRPWRDIAREDYGDQISYGLLNKFALRDGEFIPDDVKVQRLLGLYRKPRRMTPKHMSNSEAAQSWTLWMRELVKSLRTPTPKELAKTLKPNRNRIGRFEDQSK